MKQYDSNLRTAGSSEEKVRDDDHKHGEGTMSISWQDAKLDIQLLKGG